jgi:hypothetical protein
MTVPVSVNAGGGGAGGDGAVGSSLPHATDRATMVAMTVIRMASDSPRGQDAHNGPVKHFVHCMSAASRLPYARDAFVLESAIRARSG